MSNNGSIYTRTRKRVPTAPLRSARACTRIQTRTYLDSHPSYPGSEVVQHTVQLVQKVFAERKGISSAGTGYKKGDPILRMASTRCTGEIYVLTQKDIDLFQRLTPQRQPTTQQVVGIFHKEVGGY